MAEEQTAVLEQQTTEGGLPLDQQFDVEKAHDAAEQFLAATRAELEGETPPAESKPTPQRGPDGKFLKKTATPQEAPANAQSVEPSAVDPVWLDLAKEEGLSDDAIASLKSESEIEAAIQNNRVQKVQQAAQLLGMDAQSYQQFMQWRNGGAAPQGQQPVQPQQVVQPPVDEPLPEFTEDEFSPEQIAKLKPLAEQIRAAKAALAATQKLQSEVEALKAQEQQRAIAAHQSQKQAEYAQSWDKAAEKIPGFTEYFGKPSDLLRLAQTQPNHQRVRDYIGFDAHFQPTWANYVNRVGENDTALYLAIRDAWNASPYSKITSNGGARNGTNGSPRVNGSVVRQTARRTGPRETAPPSGDVRAEMDRSFDTIAEKWDARGENPFKDLGL
jgi:hypothetical protein